MPRMRLRGARTAPTEDRALTTGTARPLLLTSNAGDPTALSATASLALADVWACVRALTDAAASVPLIAYRGTQDGRQRVERGKLPDLLRRPAAGTTQAALIGQLVGHLALHGNAYVGKYRDASGEIVALGLLSPDAVAVEIRNGDPVYTVTASDGRTMTLTAADVVHIRSALTLDGILGLSPLRSCRLALGLSRELGQHAHAMTASSGLPVGVLKADSLSPEAAERLSSAWSARHSSTRDAGRIAVLSGDVTFTPLSLNLEDLQWAEQRQLSTAEIARIFRVPPWMIGAPSGDSMTYSNTEQQGLAFVTYSLRPWLVLIEQALTADPDLCRGTTYVEFLLDALLRADSRTRADVYALALDPDRGWMNRAEVRRLENLAPETESPDARVI